MHYYKVSTCKRVYSVVRNNYEVAILAYFEQGGRPRSLRSRGTLHSLLTPVRKPLQLRSSSSDLLFDPKCNTSIETRALAVGAPTLWNMFPSTSNVKSVENIAKFRHHLKTYLHNFTYPP